MSNWKETNQPASEPVNPAQKDQSYPARIPWLLLAATAIIAVIGVNGWNRWVKASAERDRLLVEVDSLRHELKEARSKELFDDLRIYSLESSPNHSSKAGLVWSQRSQKGVLEVFDLPPTPDNQPYELWIEDSTVEQPISGGTFIIGKEERLRLPFFPRSTLKNPVGFRIKVGDRVVISS